MGKGEREGGGNGGVFISSTSPIHSYSFVPRGQQEKNSKASKPSNVEGKSREIMLEAVSVCALLLPRGCWFGKRYDEMDIADDGGTRV